MPPRPEPGSHWFSSQGLTTVVEVASDRRYSKSIPLITLNHPDRKRNARQWIITPSEFESMFQAQPRVHMEWLQQGSVWRRIADDHPIAVNLVVFDGINESGYVRVRPITTDGLGEPTGARGDGVWMGGLPTMRFTWRWARVWAGEHPETPDDPASLYPEVLYRNQLATRSGVDPELAQALGSIADEPPPKPKRKKRKARKRKKPKLVRRSALDRLLDDESF